MERRCGLIHLCARCVTEAVFILFIDLFILVAGEKSHPHRFLAESGFVCCLLFVVCCCVKTQCGAGEPRAASAPASCDAPPHRPLGEAGWSRRGIITGAGWTCEVSTSNRFIGERRKAPLGPSRPSPILISEPFSPC